MSRLEGTDQVKRIRNLMSRLLGRTDRHDVSNVPPLRVSQLHKAALTFLVAASGVFFVCAQAGAIEITSMTPSSSDAIEGDSSHYITITTDVGYAYVQWYVGGKLVRTNTGNRIGTTDYLSGYDYDGLGSTTGNEVTVEAIAYRNAGNDDRDDDSVGITVWKPIRLFLYADNSMAVEEEEVTIIAQTNIPASHVIFTIGDGEPIRVDSGKEYTRHNHTFGEDQGSKQGSEHRIEAVAYATVAGKEISSPPESYKVTVFADLGFIWQATSVSIDSIEKHMGEHEYMLNTTHYAAYYNDTGKALADVIVTNLGWLWDAEDADKIAGVAQDHKNYDAEVGYAFYSITGPIHRNLEWTLRHGHFYGVEAYTRVEGGQLSEVEVDSKPGVRYHRVHRNLPPVGQGNWISNTKAPWVE